MKLILCLFFMTSVAVHAETYDYAKRWGIGAGAGYNTPIFGNSLNTAADGDTTFSLYGRYHLNSKYGLEAGYARHELSDTPITAQVMDVLAFRRINYLEKFTPILGIGVGVVDLTNYDPNSLKLGLKARGGLEYALNQDFSAALNLDYQHINKMLFSDNLPTRNAHILAAKVQLTWYFCGDKKASNHAAPATKTDKDSDNDGVLDSKDKCPSTPANTTVNAYGCAVEEKAQVKLNIFFASGKDIVTAQYNEELKVFADFMKEHPKTKVEIQGHTDSSGSKAINKSLSQKRATAVKAYLEKNFAIDTNRLTAVGYGDEQPVASNDTPAGKSENRRVVAVITE